MRQLSLHVSFTPVLDFGEHVLHSYHFCAAKLRTVTVRVHMLSLIARPTASKQIQKENELDWLCTHRFGKVLREEKNTHNI